MECSNAARALCVDSSSYSRLFAVAGNRKEEGEQHLSAGGCIPWCGCWGTFGVARWRGRRQGQRHAPLFCDRC